MTTSATVDLDAARSFLTERYGGDVDGVAEAGRGEWSVAYAFRHHGGDYVIRFGQELDDFRKDRFAARFASPALPIPRVVEIGNAFDAHYAISERLFGSYLDQLDATSFRATLPSLFAAFDAARDADLSASRGYGGWGASGDAPHGTWRDALLAVPGAPPERIAGWRENLALRPEAANAFDEAYERLRSLADACPEERHLLHNDTLNRNVFVQDGRISARISGIIDWGCGTYGDFLYEIAYMSFWWPWYPQWRDIDLMAEARRHYDRIALDVANFDERVRCYQVHTGLDNMAYCAFLGRWSDLENIARRTLAIACGES
jgi:hygromycin-B 4-O-kinase